MAKGIQVLISGEYNDRDVKRAISDLKSLQTIGHETSGAVNLLGENVSGFGAKLKAGFTEPLAGVGAALAGAFALEKVGEFFKSSIEAAIEDEKALTSLAITMRNVGDSTPAVEIDELAGKLALATGVSKDQMIPAFQRLETTLGDSEKSFSALRLAMDVSAGTGRDLEQVTLALSRGYSGSTTALSRLGAGIDKAILQSGDMAQITQALSDKFQGQAAAAADTYSGKLSRMSVAASEAKEKIGYALLGALDSVSSSLGGADGAVTLISQLGNGLAGLIQQLGSVVSILSKYSNAQQDANTQDEYSQQGYRQLIGLIPIVGTYLTALSTHSEDSARSTALANTNMQGYSAAIAAYGQTAGSVTGLGLGLADSLTATGDAASTAADSLMKASIAAATFTVFSQGRPTTTVYTGGTPTSGYSSNYFQDSINQTLAAYKALQSAHTSGGGQATQAAKQVTLDLAGTSKDLNKALKGISVSLSGGAATVSQELAAQFQQQVSDFKATISEQLQIISQAQSALDSYSSGIVSSVLGNLNFATEGKDAEGNTVSLKPEQIASLMLGDIANQQKAVGKIAGLALQLPDALTKQILTLPPDAAIALADYFSANPDMVQRLSDNYKALADSTKTLLGDPMANAFAMVGGQSAVAMIAAAKQAIAAASQEFQTWAANALHVTVTVDTSGVSAAATAGASTALDNALASASQEAIDFFQRGGYMNSAGQLVALPGFGITVPARASGGPVAGGSAYLVGENGPELFVPGIDGSIVSNAGLAAASGGNSYQITVQTGVGDPRQIGQEIVQYIKRFEASSGQVFAKA